MDMNPQRVRSAEFKTVRKGVDPDEIRVFLSDVADELERAQNQSTAMEARARAAVARLQEMSAPAESRGVDASADESETISRTLLLAQRTADTTISDAKAEADRIIAAANDEAGTTLDSTREMSVQLLAEARVEARQLGEAERQAIAGEVESLKARRDFLESDVDHLESFLVDQRNRLRDAATAIVEIADRVPGGLGDIRRPLLSASDDVGSDDDTATSASPIDAVEWADDDAPTDDALLIVTEIDEDDDPATVDDDTADSTSAAAADSFRADEPASESDTDAGDSDSSDDFRFSFDDERS